MMSILQLLDQEVISNVKLMYGRKTFHAIKETADTREEAQMLEME